ncbi:MAG: hypothetical protein ACT4PV_06760 [Planctomycetaceae bacterium]
MVRALLPLLFLAATARAQGVEVLVDKLLSGKTAPSERVSVIDALLQTDAGIDAVGKQCLDPTREEEIVHLAVERMLATGKSGRWLGRICLLLDAGETETSLGAKVRTRVEKSAEDPKVGQDLRRRLRELAEGLAPDSGGDAKVRAAAVRALALAPHREAVVAIVQVWQRDAAPEVRDECRRATENVLPVATAEEASLFLSARATWSYADLIRYTNSVVRKDRDRFRAKYNTVLSETLENAGPERLLGELETDDSEGKALAAAQLKGRIRSGVFGKLPPPRQEELARRLIARFEAEVASHGTSASAVVDLSECLAILGNGAAQGVLWRVTEPARLLDVLDAAYAASPRSAGVAEACVRLLGVIPGFGAQALLGRISQEAPEAEVRIKGVRALRERARSAPEAQDAVGRRLAELLASESDPRVIEEAILVALLEQPVEQAHDPVRALLTGSKEYSVTALQDCIVILRKIGTRQALETLLKVAEEDPRPALRTHAVAEGLLPRDYASPENEAFAMDGIARLVRSPEQSPEVRRAVIEKLGERGRRGAARILEQFRSAPELNEADRAAVVTAQFKLAERLATPGTAGVAAPDFDRAVQILESLRDDEPPDRLVALADRLVKSGDQFKLLSGSARCIRALAFARRAEPKLDEALRYFEEAADRAQLDGCREAEEARMLTAFLEFLRGVAEQDEARWDRAARCSERLAELAGEDTAEALPRRLAAVNEAIRARNRDRAAKNLEAARALGGDTARLDDLARAIEALEPAAPAESEKPLGGESAPPGDGAGRR